MPQLTSHIVLHDNVQLNYVTLILINLSFDERCTCWQPRLDADFPLVKNRHRLSVKLDHTHNRSHKLASLIDLAKVFFHDQYHAIYVDPTDWAINVSCKPAFNQHHFNHI